MKNTLFSNKKNYSLLKHDCYFSINIAVVADDG